MAHLYEDRDAASVAAANRLAAALQRRLDAQPAASLVVSGGTSPLRCFAELSTMALDWQRVTILASDDRWVPAGHADSNEKLIREQLMVDQASDATLVPYFATDMSATGRCRTLDSELRSVPFPFGAVLLGMGTDGHFASLFPDADNLATGLDIDSAALCMPVKTAASPHERISLTLAALSRSDEIVLLIFGDEKRAVYEAARNGNQDYPVNRLLLQKRAPVHTYWAP